jgi:hypothetical protein
MGEAFTRHSLRPLLFRGHLLRKTRALQCRGTADVYLLFEL